MSCSTLNGRSLARLVALVGMCAGSLSATALTAPTLKMAGFCNGTLNVGVQKSDIDSYQLQIQMKDQGADDGTYADVYNGNVSALKAFTNNSYDSRYLTFKTNFYGTATVRMRTVSGEETSAWVQVGDLSAYVNVKGTQIGTATSKGNAFDGNCFTMVDESGDPWVGYDFGKPTRIARIRFFSRPDNNCYTRFHGAQIQTASDASFSDAETIFTSSAQNTSRTAVNEIVFDEPITATCLRVLSKVGGRSSLCEFEAIPVDVPYSPTARVNRGAQPTFYPEVAWTLPAELAATKVSVGRATSPAGPFTTLATDLAVDATYTDTSAKVGLLYYYQVSCDCNHPLFPSQSASSESVSVRRWRRLDRSYDDETKLLDGLSIMGPTNGNWSAVSAQWVRAWDGNPNTFSDTSGANNHGPIGLNFGEKAWVASFAYQCRPDNYCFKRILNTALFAASGEDPELKDKVRVSALCEKATQDSTLYTQDCTTLLDAGANCYFLYGAGNVVLEGAFCCNVAELMFFGWTQSDLDNAGILVAPKELSLSRSSNGRAVHLVWDAGLSATDGYVVQRRARGESDGSWVDVATTVAGVTACDDASDAAEHPLTQGFWEYRVGGLQGPERAFSPVFSYTYYVPGDGTGLRGALFHPFAAATATLSRPDEKYDLGVGAVDFAWAKDENYAGTDFHTNVRLAWRGKLIVPMEGSYEFSLETTDGGAVYIDNTSVCNIWTGGNKTSTGSMNLTAGEHVIEVDARLENDYVGRRCVLRWGGTVPDEIIPPTQLKPADDVTFGYSAWGLDWTIRSYNGSVLGKVRPDGAGYQILSPAEEPSTVDGRNKLNATFLARKWSRSFDIQTSVKSVLHGRTGLMARAANGNLYSVYYNYDGGGWGYVGVYMVTNGSDRLESPFGQKAIAGFSNLDVDLRLAYDIRTGTFTAWWKDNTTPSPDTNGYIGPVQENPLKWTVLHTWQNDGSIAGEYEYGPVQMGRSGNKLGSSVFSNYTETLKRHYGTTIIFR